MYQRFALPKPGFADSDVVHVASEVAGSDMSEFFRRYVFGKDPLPYDRDFAYAGIDAKRIDRHTAGRASCWRRPPTGGQSSATSFPGAPPNRAASIVATLWSHWTINRAIGTALNAR